MRRRHPSLPVPKEFLSEIFYDRLLLVLRLGPPDVIGPVDVQHPIGRPAHDSDQGDLAASPQADERVPRKGDPAHEKRASPAHESG